MDTAKPPGSSDGVVIRCPLDKRIRLFESIS
jgi:hypothetical protein